MWNTGFQQIGGYDADAGGRTGGQHFVNVNGILSTNQGPFVPGYLRTIQRGNSEECRFVNIPIPEVAVGTPLSDWVTDRIIQGNIGGKVGDVSNPSSSCDSLGLGTLQQ